MLSGDAFHLIKTGEYRAIRPGAPIEVVQRALGNVPDLESHFSWGFYDDGAKKDCFYVVGSFGVHLRADDAGVLRVWLITVDAVDDNERFLDEYKSAIHFNSRGMTRFSKMEHVSRLLKKSGIMQFNMDVRSYLTAVQVSVFATLLFGSEDENGDECELFERGLSKIEIRHNLVKEVSEPDHHLDVVTKKRFSAIKRTAARASTS